MKQKSVYKYAAEAGVPVGLYLTLMSACLLGSIKLPILPMMLLPLAIGFPFLLWIMLKRIGKEEPAYQKLSSLWLCGIYTVIFGTLICMLLSGLYVTFVEPSFVHSYMMNAIEAIEQSPMATDYESTTTLMKDAIAARILPTGMQFISSMAWFTCFIGSLISLGVAFIMTRGKKCFNRAVQ